MVRLASVEGLDEDSDESVEHTVGGIRVHLFVDEGIACCVSVSAKEINLISAALCQHLLDEFLDVSHCGLCFLIVDMIYTCNDLGQPRVEYVLMF